MSDKISPPKQPLRSNILIDLLVSRDPKIRILRYILVLGLLFNSLFACGLVVSSISSYPHHRDFIQEYLSSRALKDGVNPYSPVAELAERFEPDIPIPTFPHPTPHPPPVLILAFPLAWLTLQAASFAWLLFELICLAMATFLLFRLSGRARPLLVLVCFFLLLGWPPVWKDLILGQLGSFLFLLLTGLVFAAQHEYRRSVGILLGSVMAMKFIGWPIALFYLIRKRWDIVFIAGGTLLGWNLLASALCGPRTVLTYYLEIGRNVAPLYRAHEENFSLWSLGWRLFEGTGSPVLEGMAAPPLFSLPGLSPLVSIFICIAALVVGLRLALRASDGTTSLAILVCFSILLSPVVWDHYLVIAVLPIFIAISKLRSLDLSRTETLISVGVVILALIPQYKVRYYVLSLLGHDPSIGTVEVPFLATLPSLLPIVMLLALVWLLWRLDQSVNGIDHP
jgi:hypothetical protein